MKTKLTIQSLWLAAALATSLIIAGTIARAQNLTSGGDTIQIAGWWMLVAASAATALNLRKMS